MFRNWKSMAYMYCCWLVSMQSAAHLWQMSIFFSGPTKMNILGNVEDTVGHALPIEKMAFFPEKFILYIFWFYAIWD